MHQKTRTIQKTVLILLHSTTQRMIYTNTLILAIKLLPKMQSCILILGTADLLLFSLGCFAYFKV